MLIMTRRVDEKLVTEFNGKRVDVLIMGANGNQVKVGIEADKSVSVDREEVYLRKKKGIPPHSIP